MTFYKIDSPAPIAKIIADKIAGRLSRGQKVLWIVTGGTAIIVAVEASKLLADNDLSNLTVTLTDERYGQPGHADSNWQQLEQAGLSLSGATLLPVLQGLDRVAATKEYAAHLAHNFAEADYSLGLFGIGPDGHVAGILPGSPHINTHELAVSYADNEVTKESPEGVKRGCDRITMTSAAIAKLDEAIVCAIGEAKKPWLELLEQDISVEENPAQALKKASELNIYNNYKGESI